ncbi:flavodoxin family protein, partial [Lactobacillus sp. XV13L]|nr:flavodoxin family protein [Lactobacillus sp. XV13L]
MNTLTAKILQRKIPTSATIIPKNLQQRYKPRGFNNSGDKTKVLIVAGEPRKYSLTYDLIYTAMKYLEENNCVVTLRDLYDIGFDPVLRKEEFYYIKDGLGTIPKHLAVEQNYVQQADILIFAYPNWHDTPIAIVKGYMEKVFASGFAYKITSEGPKGLLQGKYLYTIMNCGYLGGGQGY